MPRADPRHDVSAAETLQLLARLADSELRLARAELRQSARRLAFGLVLGALSAGAGLIALALFLAGLVGWLVAEQGLSLWSAASLTGGGVLGLALSLGLLARYALRADRLALRRSFASLKRNMESLKEVIHG